MSALAFMLAAQVGLAEPPQCRAIDAALSVSPATVAAVRRANRNDLAALKKRLEP